MYATREQLLAATARRYRDVPTLAGLFRLRSLTEVEKSHNELEVLGRKGGLDKDRLLAARRKLIALCVVDGDGVPLLTADDVAALEQVDAAITGALYDAAIEHCGMKPGDLEDLVKNSAGVRVE